MSKFGEASIPHVLKVTHNCNRYKTMNDKLMYISNDDKQNYPFCNLKLLVEKFGHY